MKLIEKEQVLYGMLEAVNNTEHYEKWFTIALNEFFAGNEEKIEYFNNHLKNARALRIEKERINNMLEFEQNRKRYVPKEDNESNWNDVVAIVNGSLE